MNMRMELFVSLVLIGLQVGPADDARLGPVGEFQEVAATDAMARRATPRDRAGIGIHAQVNPSGEPTITILFDNTAGDSLFEPGWGFAALVETGDHTILFDTGADGRLLLGNMGLLEAEPQAIQAVVLSHEHADHTNGLWALLGTGIRPPVFAPTRFSADFKARVQALTRLVEISEAQEVVPGVFVTEPTKSIVEQALVVATQQGAVVLTGCAHPGIVELVERSKKVVPGPVSLVAGGFHLLGATEASQVVSVAAALAELGVRRVLPTHCTGDLAIEVFQEAFQANCLPGGVGQVVHGSPG